MFILKYFKNTLRSPPIGRQALSDIFFFKFVTRSLEKKGGMSPVGGATGSPPPYLNPGRHMPLSPLSFESKNSGKKRGVRRRKAAKLCRIAYL